jgi:hypothetical protein
MRVLAASTAGAGHFTPMKPWLAHLAAAGHEVLVVGPTDLAEAASEWEFRAGSPPDPAVSHEAWDRAYADPAGAGAVVMTEIFARINSGALRPAMGAAMDDFQPDLVLREPGEYASAVEAARRGIRQVRIGICLATEERLLLDYASPVMEEWFPGTTAIVEASALLSRFPESMDPATFSDTRRYRMPSPPARAVDPDFVYATLGTVAPIMPPLQPWFPVLAEVLSGWRGEAVLTTSRRFDPAGLSARSNVAIQAWADHDDVLTRAAAIIHHGGSGTTLDALAAGCPQVIVPLFADQPANAAAVAEAGVGASVETGEGFALRTPPPDAAAQVSVALAAVLGSVEMAKRADEVSRELGALAVLDISLLA